MALGTSPMTLSDRAIAGVMQSAAPVRGPTAGLELAGSAGDAVRLGEEELDGAGGVGKFVTLP